jgi:hypothetical protein
MPTLTTNGVPVTTDGTPVTLGEQGYDPTDLTLSQVGSDVFLEWPAPAMEGATHVAIFRRDDSDLTPFTPTPETELVRVPVAQLSHTDEAVPAGDYVYQVFPLVTN